MHSQDPITKLTQTLQRDDGSQVRIVAQRDMEVGLQPRLMCTFSVVIPLKATGHCAEKILTQSGERCQ